MCYPEKRTADSKLNISRKMVNDSRESSSMACNIRLDNMDCNTCVVVLLRSRQPLHLDFKREKSQGLACLFVAS